jgi:glucosyl-dolichyl phosphate glucuronosyltransferase
MLASIIICTRNRVSYLLDTIDSLMTHPTALSPDQWELLIVNNASTDDTMAQLAARYGQHPQIRVIQEQKIGLSFARNTGIRHAKGTYILFLDDDVLVDAGWLDGYIQLFEQHEPRPDIIGGKIVLQWESPPPSWVTPALYPLLGALDYGKHPMVLTQEWHYCVGANCAYLKQSLEKAGGFNPTLGLGKIPRLGEDTELEKRIVRAGGTALYNPFSCVRHRCLPEKITRRWFIRRFFYTGLANATIFYPGRIKRFAYIAFMPFAGMMAFMLYILSFVYSALFYRAAWFAGYAGRGYGYVSRSPEQ